MQNNNKDDEVAVEAVKIDDEHIEEEEECRNDIVNSPRLDNSISEV